MPENDSNDQWGRMPPLQPKKIPAFPGLLMLLGPGIIWMGLAQGSGELIWWPYLMAKYGLGFLFLLIPACLLQYPLSYAVGQYTLLTGESIFQGFLRLNRWYGLGLWVLLIVHFLWFGAFASAGATAIVELTHWPPADWFANSSPEQVLQYQRWCWAYLTIGAFYLAVLFSPVIYVLIERVMWAIALLTLFGLLGACLHPEVRSKAGEFFVATVIPSGELAAPWDYGDLTRLLTAITFAGLGGFWLLFYSYWIREKNVGMAHHFGRITGPITGHPETVPRSGFAPEETPELPQRIGRWRRYLLFDSGVGVFGNILTTLMTCLLAYALLLPKGLIPSGEQLAVVQAEFFGNAWGQWGRAAFLIVAAAFLADTWLATADAVARIHTDVIISVIPRAERFPARYWYGAFFTLLTLISCVTLPLALPGQLLLLTGVIGVVATVAYSFGLIVLNFKMRRELPAAARPTRFSTGLLTVSAIFYLCLALAYFYARFFMG